MTYFEAIILGLVQGLAEFLPISSSGHLALIKHFFHLSQNSNLSFEIFLHLGSLLAVIIFFRCMIWKLIKSLVFFRDSQLQAERLMCFWLFLATLVTVIIGIFCKDIIEDSFANPFFVTTMIAITGLIVFISDKISDSTQFKSNKLNWKKALLIGLGQSLAMTPGISRSGTTIAVSLFVGLKRSQVIAFSFLLSIPIILGANISEIKTFLQLDWNQLSVYLVGFIMAFISGYLVFNWLTKLVAKAKLRYFAYYCWTVSFLAFFLIILGF